MPRGRPNAPHQAVCVQVSFQCPIALRMALRNAVAESGLMPGEFYANALDRFVRDHYPQIAFNRRLTSDSPTPVTGIIANIPASLARHLHDFCTDQRIHRDQVVEACLRAGLAQLNAVTSGEAA